MPFAGEIERHAAKKTSGANASGTRPAKPPDGVHMVEYGERRRRQARAVQAEQGGVKPAVSRWRAVGARALQVRPSHPAAMSSAVRCAGWYAATRL